jgi:hypothetical protein
MPLVTSLAGRAGAAFGLLQPQASTPSLHLHGPFGCEMAPTLPMRALKVLPDHLWLGLLTGSPGPDGTAGAELKHSLYARRRVGITTSNEFDFSIDQDVVFELHRSPRIRSLGLWSDEGLLLAQGRLLGSRWSHVAPDVFVFPARSLVIRGTSQATKTK